LEFNQCFPSNVQVEVDLELGKEKRFFLSLPLIGISRLEGLTLPPTLPLPQSQHHQQSTDTTKTYIKILRMEFTPVMLGQIQLAEQHKEFHVNIIDEK
jgi:hypothetical protein